MQPQNAFKNRCELVQIGAYGAVCERWDCEQLPVTGSTHAGVEKLRRR